MPWLFPPKLPCPLVASPARPKHDTVLRLTSAIPEQGWLFLFEPGSFSLQRCSAENLRASTSGAGSDGDNDGRGNRRSNDGDGSDDDSNHSDDGSTDDDSRTKPRLELRCRLQLRR